MAPRQRTDVLGQFAGGWHRRALDQHRHDEDVGPRQSRGNLESHEVVGLVEPPAAGHVAGAGPFPPDDRQHHAAVGEAGFDRLDEVLPGAQRVHVAEHP